MEFFQGNLSFSYLMVGFLFPTIIITVIIKYSWSYLVQRIFPGAVKQNLIVKDISWKIAFIITLLFVLM